MGRIVTEAVIVSVCEREKVCVARNMFAKLLFTRRIYVEICSRITNKWVTREITSRKPFVGRYTNTRMVQINLYLLSYLRLYALENTRKSKSRLSGVISHHHQLSPFYYYPATPQFEPSQPTNLPTTMHIFAPEHTSIQPFLKCLFLVIIR